MLFDVPDADAPTLRQLADYFDAQARRFRDAAYAREARARDAVRRADERARSKARMMRLGARLAVLARRGDLRAALVAMAARRPDVTLETLKAAHALWNRARKAKTVARRNDAIWRARLAGVPSRELATLHGITPRMVDKITFALEAPNRAAERGPARSAPPPPTAMSQSVFSTLTASALSGSPCSRPRRAAR
jgi:hypothetical protein